jgi:hypothetical protein
MFSHSAEMIGFFFELQNFPKGLSRSQVSACIPNLDMSVIDIADLEETTTITAVVSPINRTAGPLGLNWINFYAAFEGIPVGDTLNFLVPFEFKSRLGNRRRGRNLLQTGEIDSNFSLISIWPTRGPVQGNTLVTVRIRTPAQFTNEDQAAFRIFTQCRDRENQCLEFGQQSCLTYNPCLQQIPMSNVLKTLSTVLVVQYYSIPFLRPGNATQFLSFLGSVDTKSTVSWNFEYIANEPLSISIVTPSVGSLRGGTTVRVWISNLTILGNHSFVPSVFFGANNASVHGVQQWVVDNSTLITLSTPLSIFDGFVPLVISWNGTRLSTQFLYEDVSETFIKEIIPSSGPSEGGYSIILAVSQLSSAVQANTPSFHVFIDDKLCRSAVISDREQGSAYHSETIYLKVDVPAHQEGEAIIMVRQGYNFLKGDVQSFFGSFWFESPSNDFGATSVTVRILPENLLTSGNYLAVINLRNIPSDSVADYAVTVANISCVPLRLDLLAWSSGTLFASLPSSLDIAFVTARISAVDKNGVLRATSATFRNLVNSTLQSHVANIRPSSGSALGGTRLSVSLTGFSRVNSTSDLEVWFGGVKRSVDAITKTGFLSQFELTSPYFFCNSTCQVTVNVIGPGYVSAAFSYTYLTANPVVAAVSPSSVSSRGGDIVRVHLLNFPTVYSIYEVQVSWDGIVWNYPSQIVFSDQDNTEILLITPILKRGGGSNDFSITVLITPEINGMKSVAFELVVVSVKPRLITFSPSKGPCTGGFFVDAIIQNYPVRVFGSQDQNYVDVSGPLEPWIFLNGTRLEETNLSRLAFKSEGSGFDYTAQLTFFVPEIGSCQRGLAQMSIGTNQGSLPLVQFDMQLFEDVTVLSFFPSSGPSATSNVIISVSLCCLWKPGAVDRVQPHPVVVAGNVLCTILNMTSRQSVSNLVFQIPGQIKPGPLLIRISSSPTSGTSVQIDYFSIPSRTTEPWDLEGSKESSSWHQRPLQVAMVSPEQGPVSGNTGVRIFFSGPWESVKNFEVSDFAVALGGLMASITSLRTAESGRSIIELEFSTPGSGIAGAVKGQLFLTNIPWMMAEFFYTYYPVYEPAAIISISPSIAYQGANTSVVVQVDSGLSQCFFSIINCFVAG